MCLTIFIYYSNAAGIEVFPNLKVLIFDHNNFSSIQTFPKLDKLETLSLGNNPIRNLDQFLTHITLKVNFIDS